MFQNFEIIETNVGKKTNHCLKFSLSLSNNMDPNKYLSGHNLKNRKEGNKSLGLLKNM